MISSSMGPRFGAAWFGAAWFGAGAVMSVLGAVPAFAQSEPSGDMAMRGFLSQLFLIGSMVLIFYFLLIRPQQKKQKELQKQLAALTKGDKVLTTGGMYGTVVGIKDDMVTLEIAKDTKVDFAKGAITGVIKKE